MKNTMKKTLSLLLALTMVLSLGLPAYAVGTTDEDVVPAEEPVVLPAEEPVEVPAKDVGALPIGAGKIDFPEGDEIISEDLIVDLGNVDDLVVEEVEASPAQEFSYADESGFSVEVSAPAGAFPLGTEMTAFRMPNLANVQAAVDQAEDLNGEVKLAADISFWLNGEEVEPAEGTKLVVRMSAPEIAGVAAPIVIHIPDGENAVPEIVEQLRSDDMLLADTVAFEAESFSVYAIISGDDPTPVTPRVTYHFLTEVVEGAAEPYTFLNKAGDYVDYQIVKANDGTWEKLQDPGEPVVGLEKNFLGWFIVDKDGDAYSYTDTQIVFDDNGEAEPPVKTDATTGDKDVYVAPRYGQAFIVTFWDKQEADATETNPMHIMTKRVVYLTEGETYAKVRVDDVNVPTLATQALTGWTSDDYKEGTTTYTIMEKPEWDEVTKSFNLYPIFSDGHWLRFSGGPSGSGAGYRSAIFVTDLTQASELTNLGTITREGYTFAGWFYNGFDSPESDRVSNASGVVSSTNAETLLTTVKAAEGDTVLYAHWTGNQVSYRVATWFENANDDNYSFGEVSNRTGTAGTTTNVTAAAVDGFTAQTIEQQEIKGDGTTIVNVYYKRNIYEIKFYRATVRTSWNGSYTVTGGQQYTNLTISAKYEQNILTEWPSFKGYGAPWYVSTGSNVAWVLIVPTMPLNGHSYYERTSSGDNLNKIFWVQSVDGGNTFVSRFEAPSTGSRSISQSADDYIHIEGFRVNAASSNDAQRIRQLGDPDAVSDSNYNRSVAIGTSYQEGRYVSGTYILDFYYLRNQYNVSFNLQLSANNPSPLTGIYYEANIAEAKATQIAQLNNQYKVGETTLEVQGSGTFIFQGWYENAACLGDPFNFDQKMPAGNITLYAKWERVWYLIQIDPNGGEILPPVDEVTYTWLQYGDKIEQYNIRRDYVEAEAGYSGQKYYYYELLASEDEHRHDEEGYYYSGLRKGFYVKAELADDKDAFMAAYPQYGGSYADSNWAVISANIDKTTVYKPASSDDNYSFVGWYKADITAGTDTLTYTNEVYDFGAEIKGDTAIYAKWRRAGLFQLQYHTQNHAVDNVGQVYGYINNSLVETEYNYADKANTEIAFTPNNIVNIGSEEKKSYVFVGWKLAKPDSFDPNDPGSAQWVSDTLYKQGDEFVVDAQYADGGHFLHLVAFYEPADTNPDTLPITSITFKTNFPTGATGTGTDTTIGNLPLNTKLDLGAESVTIPYPDGDKTVNMPKFSCYGYTQIGWCTTADGETGDFFGMTDVIGLDNLNKTNNGTPNTLYAIWGPAYFYVYRSSNNTVLRVSMANYTADTTYSLTDLLKDSTEYLYGGYYRDYAGKSTDFAIKDLSFDETTNIANDNGEGAKGYTGDNVTWAAADAYKIGDEDFAGKGNAIKPVADAVYFIKEVPAADFLQQRIKFTYKTAGGKIGASWLITNADDANYLGVGSTVGNTSYLGYMADSIKITALNTGKTQTFNVSDLFGKGKKIAYKNVYWDPTAVKTGAEPFGQELDLLNGEAVKNFWVTPDGMQVTNAVARTYTNYNNAYKIAKSETTGSITIVEYADTPTVGE